MAAELSPLVKQGRELREALMEVLAINLRLLHLWRRQQCDRPTTTPTPQKKRRTKRKSRR
jgi:hypothetical protein